MPRFTGLQHATGFDPRTNFLVVGEGRTNYVVLHEGRVEGLAFDRTKLDVREVTRVGFPQFSNALHDQFITWGVAQEESARGFVGALHGAAGNGAQAHLLAVRGKVRSQSRIRATRRGATAELLVAVLPQKTVTVALRFVQHPDASGRMTTVTRWSPSDRDWLARKLNWVYGPQMNVTFDVVDADWARVAQRLGDPFGSTAFLAYVVQKKHPSADLTIFFVGDRWASDDGDAAGSTFYEEDAIAIVDDAKIPVLPGADPFVVTLAHEVAHYLRAERGFRGHHDRPGVLLSSGTESTVLDKQLVFDINPPP